ncbi:hypothetical protein BRADI_2g08147v3 [Brachypodium distachyon]|uniref:Glycosyltransferase n=2 Tax=Brachypodium distachyon TaxID=15368 RepID=I1HDP5_BRADI|nr:hypothetical protein BRADI_2g08147v3 [Brachypodium distachyon]
MANTTTTNGAAAGNHAGNESGRDHIVVFPFMAKGHTLPLLHFATALSSHPRIRLRVTVVTTPANLAFARIRLPSSVRLAVLPFPSLPPLPPGIESTDALPSASLFPAFLRATALLEEPFAAFMASLGPSPPLALVSDFFLGFTLRAAADAGARRVVFHGMSCFSMAICKSLMANPPPRPPAPGDGGSFHVARMPERVRMTAEEVPETIARMCNLEAPMTRFVIDHIGDSDTRSWGMLVNSFASLDEDYVAALESFYQPGARAWLVGPLFLAAGVGDMEEQDPEGCLSWLDGRAAGSVVYVSFGTQAHVADEQLDELARGLVGAGHPFLWAVRSDTWAAPPVDLGPDGRIVRGWVPQRSVLAHPAVGGFLSHCGWNSTMESLAAGKPILAWPMLAEQKLNAKYIAEFIGAGVKMNANGGMGRADEVERKVRRLMDGGSKEGRRMRERAAWAQQAANSAVSDGGTSQLALLELVNELQGTYCDVIAQKNKC